MPRAPETVAVVTDSTASLPADVVDKAEVTVVPLAVAVDGVEGQEGVDITPADVARALTGRHAAVTTSRPAPDRFAEVYQQLLDRGASAVVSVHLSTKLSGTLEAAALAARDLDGRVQVVDSCSTGMGLGFVALAAADTAQRGGDAAAVREAAQAAVARTSAFFYVDTLEYLRRGGRIGAASALLGNALSVKPILYVADGEIVVRDRVRTTSRALARLVDLALEATATSTVDVAVHHLGAPERAADLSERMAQRLGGRLRHRYVTEVGAAVGAHVGPGMACVVVHAVD